MHPMASENNKTILRTDACDSISIADFNNDGWLDVFCCSYHGGKDRMSTPSSTGTGTAPFSRVNCSIPIPLPADYADFNEDGYVDLAVANHKVDGDHLGFSSVWWNGKMVSTAKSGRFANGGARHDVRRTGQCSDPKPRSFTNRKSFRRKSMCTPHKAKSRRRCQPKPG